MADDDWVYTEERSNGPLFVGAITDEMVERAARALDPDFDLRPPFRHGAGNRSQTQARELARAVLEAALNQERQPEEG